MRFIQSVIASDQSLANSSIFEFELGVNPISFLVIELKALSANPNDLVLPDDLLSGITTIQVLWNGVTIWAASGIDTLAAGSMIAGLSPYIMGTPGAATNRRVLAFAIPFTRKIFSPDECLPPIGRGALLLQIITGTLNAVATAYTCNVWQCELPEAKPRTYAKATTLSRTPPATGDLDIDLPLGNRLAGLTLFGTTVPSSTVDTKTIAQARVLLDNVETDYASSRWEGLRWMAENRPRHPLPYYELSVLENLAAAYAQRVSSGSVNDYTTLLHRYLYMDFDPLSGVDYLLDLTKVNQARCRVVAGDTQPLRIIPHEIVTI